MIEEIVADVDYVLLMSVNPGFSGQKFIPSSLDKLRRLRDLIRMKFSPARIEIDGGIGPNNVAEVVAAGAEILVAGSAVFGAENPAEALKDLLRVAGSSGSGARVTA
jgi:ribulose-phosphate 3-epimerase